MATKQVIVWRQDLQGVPLGKKMAQAGHAAHLFLTEQIKANYPGAKLKGDGDGRVEVRVTQSQMDWIMGNYRKVVAFVRSEDELMLIYNKAQELGLPVHLVTDDGLTVFDKPTKTCLAIGPAEEEAVDQVTGEKGPLGKLRLL